MDWTVAVTGHRPPRLGLDYSPRSNLLLTTFASAMLKRMSRGNTLVRLVSGMAQGWDLACAHAAILVGVPVTAALPFDGHGSHWAAEARKRHDAILAKSNEVVVVSPGPYAGDASKYIKRDEYMVNRADDAGGGGILLSLFDGSEKGGTWATVRYANQVRLPICNVWQAWEKFRNNPGVLTDGQ